MFERFHHNAKTLTGAFLLLASLFYVILYLIFLPKCFTILDESAYINTAYVLRQGTFYADVAGVQVACTYPVNGHFVSKYPPGMPALLALTSFMGWKTTLAVNLFIHLLIFWLTVKLLKLLKIPTPFAVLYLFHPTAALYSRTVMADLPSGLLLTLAFYTFLNRRYAWCGACLGLAVLMRTANGIALPIFLLACFVPAPTMDEESPSLKTRGIRAAQLLLGACPLLLLAGCYAQVIAGGQMAQHTGTFALRYFPQNFPLYFAGAMAIYPAMLLSPLLYRGPGRVLIGLLCYSFLFLYSLWYFHDQGSSFAETLIVSQRYFLAILPLFILAYSAVCWKLIENWPAPRRVTLACAGTLLLSLFAVAVHFRHAKHVEKYAVAKQAILKTVEPNDMLICNSVLSKLFHPGLGTCRYRSLDNPASLKREIDSALTHEEPRILMASWIRPGRVDDRLEQQEMETFARGYMSRPLPPEERRSLPDEIKISRIFKK